MKNRREWLRTVGTASAGAILPAAGGEAAANVTVVVDPTPLFPISPHLYMQFMEPLGSTDGSVGLLGITRLTIGERTSLRQCAICRQG